jgi:hypothetical protein
MFQNQNSEEMKGVSVGVLVGNSFLNSFCIATSPQLLNRGLKHITSSKKMLKDRLHFHEI